MPISDYAGDAPGDDRLDAEPELFPIVMVYCTVKIDHARGWNVTMSVQTPDGRNTLERWGRAGGSVAHGLHKVVQDLTHGYQLAARLGPFDDEIDPATLDERPF